MAKIRLKPVGFWSYAKRDDKLSRQKISELEDLVQAELGTQIGEEVEMFRDTSSLPHGVLWEQEIRRALGDATFFIPILTPNYLRSEWCCREVEIFLERQEELAATYPDLPRRSRIFPIHYVDVADTDPVNPAVRDALMRLQHLDFRQHRHHRYDEPHVQARLATFVTDIRNLLRIPVEAPEPAGAAAAGPPPSARRVSATTGPAVRDTAERPAPPPARPPEPAAEDRVGAGETARNSKPERREPSPAEDGGGPPRATESRKTILVGGLVAGSVVLLAAIAALSSGADVDGSETRDDGVGPLTVAEEADLSDDRLTVLAAGEVARPATAPRPVEAELLEPGTHSCQLSVSYRYRPCKISRAGPGLYRLDLQGGLMSIGGTLRARDGGLEFSGAITDPSPYLCGLCRWGGEVRIGTRVADFPGCVPPLPEALAECRRQTISGSLSRQGKGWTGNVRAFSYDNDYSGSGAERAVSGFSRRPETLELTINPR